MKVRINFKSGKSVDIIPKQETLLEVVSASFMKDDKQASHSLYKKTDGGEIVVVLDSVESFEEIKDSTEALEEIKLEEDPYELMVIYEDDVLAIQIIRDWEEARGEIGRISNHGRNNLRLKLTVEGNAMTIDVRSGHEYTIWSDGPAKKAIPVLIKEDFIYEWL